MPETRGTSTVDMPFLYDINGSKLTKIHPEQEIKKIPPEIQSKIKKFVVEFIRKAHKADNGDLLRLVKETYKIGINGSEGIVFSCANDLKICDKVNALLSKELNSIKGTFIKTLFANEKVKEELVFYTIRCMEHRSNIEKATRGVLCNSVIYEENLIKSYAGSIKPSSIVKPKKVPMNAARRRMFKQRRLAASRDCVVVKLMKEEKAAKIAKAAERKAAGNIGRKLLGLAGTAFVAYDAYMVYRYATGKEDNPVHADGTHTELSVTSYTTKEHTAAFNLYRDLNSKSGKLTPEARAKFNEYPYEIVYIKFAKDVRIQKMPPGKVKAMINLTIDCINKKYFNASKFTIDDVINAFSNFEKMRLFKK